MLSLCLNRLRLLVWALFWVLFLCQVPDSRILAADWSISPGIEVTQEYNSNVLLTDDERIEDFITEVKPRIQILRETDSSRLDFNSMVIGQKYIDHDDLDTLNNETNLNFTQSWSSKFSNDLSLGFVKDNILESELDRAGLRAVRQDRYRYLLDLSNNYQLSETLFVKFGGGVYQNVYPDGPYPDLFQWLVRLNPGWAVTPRDTLGLLVDYSNGEYEDFGSIQTLSNTLYWRRDLTDTTYFTIGAGYRYSWNELDTVAFIPLVTQNTFIFIPTTEKSQSSQDGFIFNFTLNNNWTERFSTILSAGQEQYDTVDVRSTQRTYIRTTFRYLLSELTALGFEAGYDLNNETGSGNVDENYLRVAPYLEWRLKKDLLLRLAASYENLETKQSGDDFSRDRYRTWISLTYEWPRLWANH